MVSSKDEMTRPDLERVPVASIGTSAGGIAALQSFFEALPPKIGAAFVVIVHLDPERGSELKNIIAARTTMPVLEVTRAEPIKADTVYVIPPNRRLLVSAEKISSAHLMSRAESARRSICFSALWPASTAMALPSS